MNACLTAGVFFQRENFMFSVECMVLTTHGSHIYLLTVLASAEHHLGVLGPYGVRFSLHDHCAKACAAVAGCLLYGYALLLQLLAS